MYRHRCYVASGRLMRKKRSSTWRSFMDARRKASAPRTPCAASSHDGASPKICFATSRREFVASLGLSTDCSVARLRRCGTVLNVMPSLTTGRFFGCMVLIPRQRMHALTESCKCSLAIAWLCHQLARSCMACCVLVPRGCLIALKGMATKQGLLCSESPLLLRRVIGKSWLPLCLHLLVYSQHTLFGLLRRFAYYPLPNLHLGDTHCSFGGVAQAVMALYYIYRLLGVWVAPIILATLDLARSLVGSIISLHSLPTREGWREIQTWREKERERDRESGTERRTKITKREREGRIILLAQHGCSCVQL